MNDETKVDDPRDGMGIWGSKIILPEDQEVKDDFHEETLAKRIDDIEDRLNSLENALREETIANDFKEETFAKRIDELEEAIASIRETLLATQRGTATQFRR